MPPLTLAAVPREIYGYCAAYSSAIETLLLHDNVLYKSVQKQSWHTGVLINAAVKRETGCDAIK